jgi:DNA-binding CsgD family transcriptional regulator/DNA-binding transcriptional regulator YiaG
MSSQTIDMDGRGQEQGDHRARLSKREEIVARTVKSLRLALGDTQQSFAHRTGLSISTAVRYETSKPPRGKALVQMEQLARENGIAVLADIFNAALSLELGFKAPRLGRSKASPRPGTEEDHSILAMVLAHPDWFPRQAKAWARLRMEFIRTEADLDGGVVVLTAIEDEIARLTASGKSIEEIAAEIGHDPEHVRWLKDNGYRAVESDALESEAGLSMRDHLISNLLLNHTRPARQKPVPPQGEGRATEK